MGLDSKGPAGNNQSLDECNQDALKAHNELRAKHGVPPVKLAQVIYTGHSTFERT